jgi:hypothetical protein
MPYCPECSAEVPVDVTACPTCQASLAVTPDPTAPPDSSDAPDLTAVRVELAAALAPQYKLLRLLGAGGMGAVYLARDPTLTRLVAVKVMYPGLAAQAAARTRFQREARAAAALSHPNIVRVYAVGETAEQGLPYIVMQHVEGATLADWMAERPRRSERDVRRIVGQVAAALAAAHARELVHRDVKPTNVLVERDSGRPYVADFGVSAALSRSRDDTRLTATGMVLGTPAYMSPEQAAGEPLTPQSDVYSLGVLAYELLTGGLPFEAESVIGVAAAHLRDTPPPVAARRPDVSPEVARLVDRCLAKKPAGRPTPNEIARGMLPSLDTEIEWPPPGLGRLHGRAKVLVRVLLATVAAGLLAALAFAATPEVLLVHPRWLARFDVAEQLAGPALQLRATSPETGEVAFFVWQTALWLAAAAFGLGVIASLTLGWRAARLAARELTLGWAPTTLLDVAGDHDGRSGRILAGTGELVSLDPGQRTRLLASRRAFALATLGGAAWLVGTLCGWAVLAAVGPLGGGPMTPAGTAGPLPVLALPGVAALAAALVFRWRERRMLAPLGRRPGSPVTADEVTAWYDALPSGDLRPVAPSVPGNLRRAGRGALAAAALAGLVVTLAVGGLVVASVSAARFVQREAPRTAELLVALDRLSETDPVGLALGASWRYLRGPRQTDDSAALALVASLTASEGATALPGYAVPVAVLRAALDSLVAAAAPDVDSAGARPADSAGAPTWLAALDAHPRTVAFRRLARTGGPDPVWAARDRPLREYETPDDVPVPRLDRLLEAAYANAAAALDAAGRGDRDGALDRLSDNVAVAHRLLASSALIGNVVGQRILHRGALVPLAALETRVGNAPGALALRDAARQLDGVRFSLSGTSGLAVNPEDPHMLRRAIGNRAVPPGYRAELLFAAWAGLCANRWELLTGPSTTRRDTFFAIADSLTDVPEARALAQLVHRTWRGLEPPDPEPRRRSRIQWTPWMVAHRLNLCARAQ